MQLLTTVDADEVSPVRRGANRKKVVLKADEGVRVEAEIADIMAVPWEREGAMVDELRKEDADESVVKAAVGAMRLLQGIKEELPDEMREAVEKLGTELYARTNPKLNSGGAPSPGDLTGSASGEGEKDGSGSSSEDLTGRGKTGGLEASGGPGAKVAADAEPDEDDDPPKKGKKKRPAFLSKAFGRGDGDESGDTPDNEPETDPDDTTIEKGDPVADTHAVPIQKEDGSWDLTGVPEVARPVWETVLKAQAETAVKLEKAETELAETRDQLRTKDIIAKAETQFQAVGARDDVVAVLKDASEKLDPEGYERLVTVLAAANERITTGDLFKEAGYTGGAANEGGGDAWEKIEKAAKELVEKTGDLTEAQAIDRVLKTQEGAALYSAYMRENGMGVS